MPVVLYGCETWSLPLREERRLSVFENRVLRRVFGPGRDEITGECRKLHKEELNVLYSSPNIVRVMKFEENEMGGACSASYPTSVKSQTPWCAPVFLALFMDFQLNKLLTNDRQVLALLTEFTFKICFSVTMKHKSVSFCSFSVSSILSFIIV